MGKGRLVADLSLKIRLEQKFGGEGGKKGDLGAGVDEAVASSLRERIRGRG
jgi:hypothetical protein